MLVVCWVSGCWLFVGLEVLVVCWVSGCWWFVELVGEGGLVGARLYYSLANL